jgi:hypothetical protein
MTREIDLLQHYEQLKSTLLRVGYFRRGSLVKRFMVCGKPSCACRGSPPRLHGPYYQWTRKVKGKTQTVFYTPEQAELLSGWIAAGRELEHIVAQMERLSLRVTDRLLKELAPAERKPRAVRTPAKRTAKG